MLVDCLANKIAAGVYLASYEGQVAMWLLYNYLLTEGKYPFYLFHNFIHVKYNRISKMTTVTFKFDYLIKIEGLGGPASGTVKRLHALEPRVNRRLRIMASHAHFLAPLVFLRRARMVRQWSFICLFSA